MTLILLLIACICPIWAFPLILLQYKNTKKPFLCAFLFGLAASAAVYGYIADQGNDIYRHINNMLYYKEVSFFQIFDAGPLNAVYVWDIWQWVVANLHNDLLLQSSGAFVGYTLVAYMIFDYAKIRGFESSVWLPSLIIAMLTVSPISLAIGIRSGNAYIICALAIYLYYTHGQNYFGMLFCIFMTIFLHHSTIVVFALWLLYPVFKKKPFVGAVLITAAMFTYTNYEAYISFFMSGGSIFESMGEDLQQSVVAYTGRRLNNFHNTTNVVLGILLVTLLFIRGGGIKSLLFIQNRDDDKTAAHWINEFQLLMLVTTYCLIVLLSYNGNRFYLIALVLSFLPIMDQFQDEPFIRSKRYFYVDLVIAALALTTFSIYLYDMNWGTGSLLSFAISLLTGFFSRLMV